MAEPFIGEIKVFAFSFAPENWAVCEGALLSISQNQALHSLLGTAFGGDGKTTFGLPDFRGRIPVGMGMNPWIGTDRNIGKTDGHESHTMTKDELPAHYHLATFNGTLKPNDVTVVAAATDEEDADSNVPAADAIFAKAIGDQGQGHNANIYNNVIPNTEIPALPTGGILQGNVTLDNTGQQAAFSLIQPITVMFYGIAMQGLYPSRS